MLTAFPCWDPAPGKHLLNIFQIIQGAEVPPPTLARSTRPQTRPSPSIRGHVSSFSADCTGIPGVTKEQRAAFQPSNRRTRRGLQGKSAEKGSLCAQLPHSPPVLQLNLIPKVCMLDHASLHLDTTDMPKHSTRQCANLRSRRQFTIVYNSAVLDRPVSRRHYSRLSSFF